MKKLNKGDEVIVIAGKDKGKTGKIKLIKDDRVIVEGVNLVKKHTKANPNANQPGGILEKEMSLHRSNVMVYDGKKRSRVGVRKLKDGEKVRYLKSNDQVLEVTRND